MLMKVNGGKLGSIFEKMGENGKNFWKWGEMGNVFGNEIKWVKFVKTRKKWGNCKKKKY